MRLFLLVPFAAAALGACSDNGAPAPATEAKTEASTEAPVSGLNEARVNMAPIDPAKAKALMHTRHEGMETIGDEFKKLRREFGGASPNMAAVAASAATVDRLAKASNDWFPTGTGPDAGKTEAKAEIWQKPQDFAAKHAAFLKASASFNAAAKAGDMTAAKAAYGELGKTCKACHDPYREDH